MSGKTSNARGCISLALGWAGKIDFYGLELEGTWGALVSGICFAFGGLIDSIKFKVSG